MKQGHNLGVCRGKTNLYPNLSRSSENLMLAPHTVHPYLKSSQPTFVSSLVISLCQLRLGLSLGTHRHPLD